MKWFTNVRAYRVTGLLPLYEPLVEAMEGRYFKACAKSQAVSMGWVEPMGEQSEHLAYVGDGGVLLCMRREEKVLPAAVVRDELVNCVANIEDTEGRKVYRKELLTLKDEIVQSMLPQAFTRSTYVHAYIDPGSGWMFIDTASATRAEELLNLLRECVGSFPVLLPQVNNAPAASMTAWLVHHSVPDDIELGQDCVLREPGEAGGVVRCRGVDMMSEEVQGHLEAGKQVERLAIAWDERLALVLSDDLVMRRLRFSDELLHSSDNSEDEAETIMGTDFKLMTSAITGLMVRIVALFGGEAE